MENLKSYTIKYLGQTKTKPSRIKITDNLNKNFKVIPFDSDNGDMKQQAKKYLGSCLGIDIIYFSELSIGKYLLLTRNFYSTVL